MALRATDMILNINKGVTALRNWMSGVSCHRAEIIRKDEHEIHNAYNTSAENQY